MLVHKRQQYLYSQTKTAPQSLFSVECNFPNATSWAIGFYANGFFCFQRPRKNVLVIANLHFDETPEYPAQMGLVISLPGNQARRVRHVATCSETPVSTAAKPCSSC